MASVDRHLTISTGYIAGPAAGIMMAGAPAYFDLTRQVAGALFWGGLYIFFSSCIIALGANLRAKGAKNVNGPILVICLGLAVVVLGFVWLYWPQKQSVKDQISSDTATQPLAYFPTQAELDRHAPNIGKPTSDIVTAVGATMSEYENAIVLWTHPPKITYRLSKADRSYKTFVDQQKGAPDDKYYNDDAVRKMLRLTRKTVPPWGGVAELWEQNPSEWNWIGTRKWVCDLTGTGSVRYREYENGVVFVSFPVRYDTVFRDVYYLAHGRWTAVPLNEAGPPCITIGSAKSR